jgi:hypothetical protein
MYTNLYLVEKLDGAHREDMLQEAAHDRRSAGLRRTKAYLMRRAAVRLGATLVKLGSWLERSAQRNGRMAVGS